MIPNQSNTVAEVAPTTLELTDYDLSHMIVYLRLLDAARDGAGWEEASRIVLNIDPDVDRERARRVYHSHYARARWMTQQGYKELLKMPNS
ncbi:DUF2285 domain-containing protein [Methylocystis sp. H62]|uniref:DUF2285 domain-containing protein n=1 Tax=Methylocystis rosea TaxID=173366 RepID=A0A3G8MCY3_9HYPH|nr:MULTISPECIES: DUF2285 domain-containing protein [Methylocystis]MBG0797286.1 DUF2285 domain-containing protein [Methylocystis sp. L43]MBG0804689.1 DUF2285 domain-containing protein [Methylocystis sp. H15]AZG79040.1 DUF2285 domain-containing protein [Methylocystis rosea]MBG0792739.1 DUF2285 domain-containing protein [Methylocystis sp. H62]QGM95935.1 DUF2285 domain-containing protein [Methylocystis rosea]